MTDGTRRPAGPAPCEERAPRTLHGTGPFVASGQSGAQEVWCAADLKLLLGLPIAFPIAWLLPETGLHRLALAFARRWQAPEIARARAQAEAIVGARRLAQPLDQAVERRVANTFVAFLLVLRCWRPGGWRANARLEGRAHLDRALAAGKGVILWAGPFAFTRLVAKITLHDAGFHVSHLSRYDHGFSTTRLGVRILNPLLTKVEARLLAERLVMEPNDKMGPVRRLRRRLAENRVVSITAQSRGRLTIEVPFLDAVLDLANGAPALAVTTGAALLPMVTIAERPGRYVTIIEPPLALGADRDRRRAAEDLAAQYAAVLERHALRWPDQLTYWSSVIRPL